MRTDTIYALSSGTVPSGIAIIRFSGPRVRFVFETMCGKLPVVNRASLVSIRNPTNSELLDRAIGLYFMGPNSFTGEDCGEFQVHGGIAVVNSVLGCLASLPGIRAAEAGEFTRAAFENGKIDLTEVEGLSDIIAAKTEKQLRQALEQADGRLSELYDRWRKALIDIRAQIESRIDFSDEGDVPDSLSREVLGKIFVVLEEIQNHLDDQRFGEIIREGFNIAIMGPPNSGKSSLMNALARRDVAIVSSIAGTTRDVLEVQLNIAGYQVNVFDTAGIRDTDDVLEGIGIDRAKKAGAKADLVLWLNDGTSEGFDDNGLVTNILKIHSKSDLRPTTKTCREALSISVITDGGLDDLIGEICKMLSNKGGSDILLSRVRHREMLTFCEECLKNVKLVPDDRLELISEELRIASHHLGKIVGRVDIEDIMDVIFAEFCIGK